MKFIKVIICCFKKYKAGSALLRDNQIYQVAFFLIKLNKKKLAEHFNVKNSYNI